MKKYITMLILSALLLNACGGEETKPLGQNDVIEGVSTTDSPSTAEPSPFITTEP